MPRLQSFVKVTSVGITSVAVVLAALSYKPRLVEPYPLELARLGAALAPKGYANIEYDCHEVTAPLPKNALDYDALALTKAMFGGFVFWPQNTLMRRAQQKDNDSDTMIWDTKSLPREKWNKGKLIASEIEVASLSAKPSNFVERVELKHILPSLHGTLCLEAKRSDDNASVRYRLGCTCLDPRKDARLPSVLMFLHRVYARALLQDAVRQLTLQG